MRDSSCPAGGLLYYGGYRTRAVVVCPEVTKIYIYIYISLKISV